MTISYSGTTFVGETYAADVVVTEKGSPSFNQLMFDTPLLGHFIRRTETFIKIHTACYRSVSLDSKCADERRKPSYIGTEEIQLAQPRAYNASYLYYRTPLIISGFTGCCYTRNTCYSFTWAGYPYLTSATPIPDVPRAGNITPPFTLHVLVHLP